MWLFLIFVGVPLLEIALFIQVGGLIGLGWTLATVVLTALLGTWLVRTQGLMAINDLRNSFSDIRDPTEPLVHGAMILIAGAMLLTPGFFTDAVGFLLLFPPFRRAAYSYLRSRIRMQSFAKPSGEGFEPHDDSVIDGDFEELKSQKYPTHRPSGWTKH